MGSSWPEQDFLNKKSISTDCHILKELQWCFFSLFSCFPVMNNYQAAAQAGFPPASPHGGGGHGGPQGRSFPAANSPGPIDMYSTSAAAAAAAAAADSVASYVQAAASPQPPTTAFPAIAVSRAPLNYSPVSFQNKHFPFALNEWNYLSRPWRSTTTENHIFRVDVKRKHFFPFSIHGFSNFPNKNTRQSSKFFIFNIFH